MRRTKILATIGPASDNVETMIKMINAGMDGARVNFSHATHDTALITINNIKEARDATKKPVTILLDTKGPEIRTKTLNADKVYLEQGNEFVLTTRDVVGDQNIVSVTYENLPKDLSVGNRVLIDDGLIELKVTALTKTDIKCVLINSGFLGSKKGINLPDTNLNLPSLTEQDVSDIIFGVEHGVDWVAASFIRTANDVVNIRKVLDANGGKHVQIMAKIENRDGVKNIDSILTVVDAIMVARGDLGVEIPPEDVPIVQKSLIKKCIMSGKPVVTATHMLESMVSNPRPTRAEANDVANAIFDGTDVVMLSGETAKGQWPIEAINMMARIAVRAEGEVDYKSEYSSRKSNLNRNTTNAISYAAMEIADELKASCIVPITDSGFAARMVSRSRPNCPIVAVTQDAHVCRQLNLSWGILPTLVETAFRGDSEIFDLAEQMALQSGLAKNGEIIVALAGVPVGIAGTTNTIRVRTVGNVLATGKGNKLGTAKGITRVFHVGDHEERSFFEEGDIIIATQTDDTMMEYIKKAGAMVIGTWENVDSTHAETVAKALDIPLLKVDVRIVDFVLNGMPVTVDTNKGLLLNGYK